MVRMGHTTSAQMHKHSVFRPIPRCGEVPREQVHGHQVTASYWRLGRSTIVLRLKDLQGTKGRAEQT